MYEFSWTLFSRLDNFGFNIIINDSSHQIVLLPHIDNLWAKSDEVGRSQTKSGEAAPRHIVGTRRVKRVGSLRFSVGSENNLNMNIRRN